MWQSFRLGIEMQIMRICWRGEWDSYFNTLTSLTLQHERLDINISPTTSYTSDTKTQRRFFLWAVEIDPGFRDV